LKSQGQAIFYKILTLQLELSHIQASDYPFDYYQYHYLKTL